MTEVGDDLELALDRLVNAARAHLAAVRAAEGATDDDGVWSAFVELNNATAAYDELLQDEYGEMTPWDVADEIAEDDDPDLELAALTAADAAEDAKEPDNLLVSVRQRRDFLVPHIDALLAAADDARRLNIELAIELEQEDIDPDAPIEPVNSVGEALYELMHAGGGSLAGLDVPELVPRSGLVLANVLDETLEPADLDGPPEEAAKLLDLPGEAPLIFSLYEPVYDGEDDEDEDGSGPDAS